MKSVGDHLDTTKKLEIKHSLHDLKKVYQKYYVEILNNMRDLIIMAQDYSVSRHSEGTLLQLSTRCIARRR